MYQPVELTHLSPLAAQTFVVLAQGSMQPVTTGFFQGMAL